MLPPGSRGSPRNSPSLVQPPFVCFKLYLILCAPAELSQFPEHNLCFSASERLLWPSLSSSVCCHSLCPLTQTHTHIGAGQTKESNGASRCWVQWGVLGTVANCRACAWFKGTATLPKSLLPGWKVDSEFSDPILQEKTEFQIFLNIPKLQCWQ